MVKPCSVSSLSLVYNSIYQWLIRPLITTFSLKLIYQFYKLLLPPTKQYSFRPLLCSTLCPCGLTSVESRLPQASRTWKGIHLTSPKPCLDAPSLYCLLSCLFLPLNYLPSPESNWSHHAIIGSHLPNASVNLSVLQFPQLKEGMVVLISLN